MSIKINYSNKAVSKSFANLVLFADEKYSINGLKKHLSISDFSYVSDLLKTADLKKICLFLRSIQKKNSINFYQKDLKSLI